MAIHAIIPAAGWSRRMGRPKLVLDLAGRTVIGRLVDALQSCRLDSITIVHRRNDAALHEQLQQIVAEPANERPAIDIIRPQIDPPDMRTSVKIAVEAIQSKMSPIDQDCWLLIPADHPIVEQRVLNELLHVWNRTSADVLVPTFQGQGGHPTLLRWHLAGQVASIPPDRGINWLVRQSKSVSQYEVDSDSVLCDLDTPEDYQRIVDRFELSANPSLNPLVDP